MYSAVYCPWCGCLGFSHPLLKAFTSLCLQLFCMSVHMCERDYLHSCVLSALSADTRLCVSQLASGPAPVRSPPRLPRPPLSRIPLHLPARPPSAPPFALFTHDTLNQEEINADDAFTVSLSPSFRGWILRWQQHWGNSWCKAFSKAGGCLCTECVCLHVCDCTQNYCIKKVRERERERK